MAREDIVEFPHLDRFRAVTAASSLYLIAAEVEGRIELNSDDADTLIIADSVSDPARNC